MSRDGYEDIMFFQGGVELLGIFRPKSENKIHQLGISWVPLGWFVFDIRGFQATLEVSEMNQPI